ncbi:MAG: FAD-dependent oxidoreductase [Deltaproteobacteria bacterium]|nr:FAD-dependent oxidoreductase [Deltaproteobacteria bacterium]
MNKLFQPIKIADVEIKNRIAMSPMGTNLCEENGTVTDRQIEYFEERAKGGAGLIFVVSCYNDFGFKMPGGVALEDDRFLPGIRRLTDTLHSYGAKVFAQLMHQGASAHSLMLGHQAVSASAVFSDFTHEMPREMTIPEIKETIEHFGEGALRAKEGGFDGVEVIGQGGYLFNQFLSPLTNKRNDEYGGDLERRMKFPIEVIHKIRGKVGPGFPISYRTCGDSFMPGGNRQKDIQMIMQAMDKAGVDIINVAAGWHQCRVPLITMCVPRGAYVYLTRGIKKVVNVPVIACHRIGNPILAEQVLLDNSADMIGMGRALLVDPDLPNKVAQGRYDEIRPCVACSNCFDGLRSHLTCAFNPALTKEKAYQIIPAKKPKKVIVVGGGPGGMEAARVLALRGHRVTLFEKSRKLGGQVNLAAIPPEREEFVNAVAYFSNEMKRLNIRVELGKEADIDVLKNETPDAVVIATGGTPIRPDIPGIDGKNVVYASDVLERRVEVGESAVVVCGGAIGCETALFIAKQGTITPEAAVFLATRGAMDAESAIRLTQQGKKVIVFEMLDKIGRDIGRTSRWTIIQSLRLHDVEMHSFAEVIRITESGVVYMQDGEERKVGADTVVIAAGTQPETALFEAAKDIVPEIYRVGDCIEPRMIMDAVHEAAEVGRKI